MAHKLEVEQIFDIDGGQLLGYYSKGHHEDEPFREAVAEWDEDWAEEVIHRDWMRTVPLNNGLFCTMQFFKAIPKSRGAFPVTYVGEM